MPSVETAAAPVYVSQTAVLTVFYDIPPSPFRSPDAQSVKAAWRNRIRSGCDMNTSRNHGNVLSPEPFRYFYGAGKHIDGYGNPDNIRFVIINNFLYVFIFQCHFVLIPEHIDNG